MRKEASWFGGAAGVRKHVYKLESGDLRFLQDLPAYPVGLYQPGPAVDFRGCQSTHQEHIPFYNILHEDSG